MPQKGKPHRRFGSRIIGEQAAEEEKKFVDEKRVKFGPKVLGTQSEKGTTPLPGSQPVERTGREVVAKDGEVVKQGMMLSITTMKTVLQKNPALVGELLETELERPEGPRKGALLAMRDVYQTEEQQQRIIAALEDLGVETKVEDEEEAEG